jgi:hypothetical protein
MTKIIINLLGINEQSHLAEEYIDNLLFMLSIHDHINDDMIKDSIHDRFNEYIQHPINISKLEEKTGYYYYFHESYIGSWYIIAHD